MATRRERLEAKLEKRQEWAEKAGERSSTGWDKGHKMADGIPFGQPILIGHHSEQRDRSYRDRIQGAFQRAYEQGNLAKHHEQKADGLERQLETSIFSDDPDAIPALEAKLAGLEAKRERYKLINKTIRKGGLAAADKMEPPMTEQEKRALLDIARSQSYLEPEKKGFPSYVLQNLGGNITRVRERIAEVQRRQARAERAEEAGGVTVEGGDWVSVTFAEKPDRGVLNALKEAGFRWSGGSWRGKRENLPQEVQ